MIVLYTRYYAYSGVTCQRPADPTNGKVVGDQQIFQVGDDVWFRCDSGFEMIGVEGLTCQNDGTFDPEPPTCQGKK